MENCEHVSIRHVQAKDQEWTRNLLSYNLKDIAFIDARDERDFQTLSKHLLLSILSHIGREVTTVGLFVN